ncbi:MAG: LacI family transcriptional regulator [Actinomycetia bacterium]|nr:LacI family transcriptional regulator [Actinomycetes bacterium]
MPPVNKPVKLAHVALAAGVSEATASLALRKVGRVAPDTRDRVIAAARRLGYSPDARARSLRVGASPVVGVLADVEVMLGSPERPRLFWPRLLWGLTSYLSDHGVGVCTVTNPDQDFVRKLAVDAFLVIGIPDLPDLSLGALDHVPTLLMGKLPKPGRPPVAYHDLRGMTMTALDHLVDAGAQRPGLLTYGELYGISEKSYRAYRIWCQDKDLDPIIIDSSDNAVVSQRIAQAQASGMDAIYGAIGGPERGLEVIGAAGLEVPNDLLLAVLGEGAVERLLRPTVTTLSLEGRASGEALGEAMLALLRGESLEPLKLPWTLAVRESSVPR